MLLIRFISKDEHLPSYYTNNDCIFWGFSRSDRPLNKKQDHLTFFKVHISETMTVQNLPTVLYLKYLTNLRIISLYSGTEW